MAILPKVSHFPNVLRTSGTLPPKCRALLLCISYSSFPDGSDPANRPSPLAGPWNDAKEMKATLIDCFHYPEEGIFVMTDEEENVGTEHWPSKKNILRAMDNLVRDTTPGDALVFLYSGHADRLANDVGGNDAYILTCDDEKIFDYDIRRHLVGPLPGDCRLTAILDACYSGMLLKLEHYDCHRLVRRHTQSFSERKKPLSPHNAMKRRHTDTALQPWVMGDNPHLRSAFKRAATAKRVVVRLKSLVANKLKSVWKAFVPPTPRPRCGSCFRKYELNGPLVISVSACSSNEKTWEDSKRNGKGMTAELIKILRKNPSIHVGDLDQQLKKCLSKLAFERVLEARTAFRTNREKLSPEDRLGWEEWCASRGYLNFKSRTSQFGSLRPLRLDDQFILECNHTGDLDIFLQQGRSSVTSGGHAPIFSGFTFVAIVFIYLTFF